MIKSNLFKSFNCRLSESLLNDSLSLFFYNLEESTDYLSFSYKDILSSLIDNNFNEDILLDIFDKKVPVLINTNEEKIIGPSFINKVLKMDWNSKHKQVA